MRKLVITISTVSAAIVAFWFAILDASTVTVDCIFGSFTLPIFLVVFMSLAAGIGCGLLLLGMSLLRRDLELRSLRGQLARMGETTDKPQTLSMRDGQR